MSQSNSKVVSLDAARRKRSSSLRVVPNEHIIHPAVALSVRRGRERRKELEQLILTSPQVPTKSAPPKKEGHVSYYLGAACMALAFGCMIKGNMSKEIVKQAGYDVVALALACTSGYLLSKEDYTSNKSTNHNSYKE